MSIVDGLLIPVLVAPTWHCMSLGIKEVLQEITLDVIIAKWIKFQESNIFFTSRKFWKILLVRKRKYS